ncbi:RPS6 protein kinase [Balamuthia mandrillaris]
MFEEATLTVTAVEGSSLAAKDMGGTSDPYCILSVDGQKAKTKVKKKTLDPKWNETFTFKVYSPTTIHLEVWDKDLFTADDFLGQVDIPLSDLSKDEEVDDWYSLNRRRSGEFVCGQIHLNIHYTSEQKRISVDDFEILKCIGEGSYGKVFQVRKKDTGMIYAMKVLKKQRLLQEGEVEHTLTEQKILKDNVHPFLVNLKFCFQTDKKIYFIMDFVNGGELFFHLKKDGKFSEEKVRFYAAEIVLALGHLHSLGIIYRDLKPENVLLESSGHCRLTDFGLAKGGIHGTKTTTFCGTPEYLAPEVIAGEPYGKEIDWWSLGTIMYELFTTTPPFYCPNQREMYRHIMKDQPRWTREMSEEAVSLMSALMEKDPTKRLGSGPGDAEDIKAHPFFKSIKWDKLLEKKVKPPIVPKTKGLEDTSNVDPMFKSKPARDSISEADATNLSDSLDEQMFGNFSFVSTSEIRKGGQHSSKEDRLKMVKAALKGSKGEGSSSNLTSSASGLAHLLSPAKGKLHKSRHDIKAGAT